MYRISIHAHGRNNPVIARSLLGHQDLENLIDEAARGRAVSLVSEISHFPALRHAMSQGELDIKLPFIHAATQTKELSAQEVDRSPNILIWPLPSDHVPKARWLLVAVVRRIGSQCFVEIS